MREYFNDHDFQTRLTAEERECYIGLAQLADDHGWLDWMPPDIAGHVFKFQTEREARLEAAAQALITTKRLRIYACGHAQLLRWGTRRRHVGREQPDTFSVEAAHRAHRTRRETSAKRQRNDRETRIPLPNLTSPNLTSPTNGRARSRGGAPTKIGTTSEFQRLVPKDQALPQKNGGLLSGSEKRHD